MKRTILVILTLIALAALIFFLTRNDTAKQVSNFEECAAAGNPVMESYPRQCRHEGELYVEKITNPPPAVIESSPPATETKIAAQAWAVQTELANKLGISADSVTIVSMESKDWTDSCLGLGGPAESCLQAITPGYEVTAQVEGKNYIYRTNIDGTVVRESN